MLFKIHPSFYYFGILMGKFSVREWNYNIIRSYIHSNLIIDFLILIEIKEEGQKQTAII